ncbi:adhesion G protein-coupled receptor E1-like isoform X1 [Homalodisca vitripennis]|uniref:adhesion G protein-coupled receptor E1-like isoform X1 n=2 Tax=Homalodisca vitripennis TaxID=197043 RepID=UPI001EEADA9A|nr:adhesion G protein-coupled receptor E1-like isoform X1 [Homalodisca vitripennis]
MCSKLNNLEVMKTSIHFILLTLCAPILGISPGNNTSDINCETSDDCSSDKVCLDFKCEDPCLGVCGFNTVCHTVNNVYMCACKPGYIGYPFSGCYHEGHILLECTMNSDCPEEMECKNKHCGDVCKNACGLNSHCKGIRHRPVCSCSPGHVWDPFLGCQIQKIKECTEHSDCLSNRTCSNYVCVDPCDSVCGNNTICTVENHTIACACTPEFIGNPFQNCVSQGTIELQKKYYIGKEEVTWTTAIERCRSMDMYFASITSPSEQEDIKNAGKQSGIAGLVWVSGSDLGSAGEYVWNSTGKGFTYTNWKYGEPEVSDDYRCVALDTFDYKWQTRGCNFKRYYACEYFRS